MLWLPIILSLFWAVCSTVLVRPWFWHSLIKRKTLVGDEQHTGLKNDFGMDPICAMKFQAGFGIITFIVSACFYFGLKVRYNFYGSIIPILLALLFQWLTMKACCLDKKYIAKTIAIIAIAIIVLILGIGNIYEDPTNIAEFDVDVPIVLFPDEQSEKAIALPSKETIASLFKVTNVSGPEYSNGKFIYNINGYGIVVINENSAEKAKLVKYNYGLGISTTLRQKYPFNRIMECGIVVSDDDVPWGKYAILRDPMPFQTPEIDKYVLQNMVTGEFREYLAHGFNLSKMSNQE